MFDILKKKISSFVQGIADKVSQKTQETPEWPASAKTVEKNEPVLQEKPVQDTRDDITISAASPVESSVATVGGIAGYSPENKKETGKELEVRAREQIQEPAPEMEKINPKPSVEAREQEIISTKATQKPDSHFIKTDATERQIAPKLGIISK